MKPETKARVKALRDQISRLTDEQRQQIIDRGIVGTIEGRTLSYKNTILMYLQLNNGRIPSIVGGIKQWNKAGRKVIKGEHGNLIWFPAGRKDEDGNIEELDRFYVTSVFDISQTEPSEALAS